MKHVIELDEEQEAWLEDSTNQHLGIDKETSLSIIIELGFEELGYR